MTSLHVKNICKELFPGPGYLQDGDVVELIGDQSSGKSAVLQELMITCLIPSLHGGCGCGVVYFDVDCHLDLLNVVSIMQCKTGASEESIKIWLKNLFVLKSESMEQVVISLHALDSLLANSKVPIGMIIIDSVSSFYWIDHNNGSNHSSKEKNILKVVAALKKLKDQYQLCILASCQSLLKSDKQSNKDSGVLFRPFLNHHWQSFITHQYLLTKNENCKDSEMQTYTAKLLPSSSKSFATHFAINKFGVKFVPTKVDIFS